MKSEARLGESATTMQGTVGGRADRGCTDRSAATSGCAESCRPDIGSLHVASCKLDQACGCESRLGRYRSAQ